MRVAKQSQRTFYKYKEVGVTGESPSYRKGDGNKEAVGVKVSINESAVQKSGTSQPQYRKQEREGKS